MATVSELASECTPGAEHSSDSSHREMKRLWIEKKEKEVRLRLSTELSPERKLKQSAWKDRRLKELVPLMNFLPWFVSQIIADFEGRYIATTVSCIDDIHGDIEGGSTCFFSKETPMEIFVWEMDKLQMNCVSYFVRNFNRRIVGLSGAPGDLSLVCTKCEWSHQQCELVDKDGVRCQRFAPMEGFDNEMKCPCGKTNCSMHWARAPLVVCCGCKRKLCTLCSESRNFCLGCKRPVCKSCQTWKYMKCGFCNKSQTHCFLCTDCYQHGFACKRCLIVMCPVSVLKYSKLCRLCNRRICIGCIQKIGVDAKNWNLCLRCEDVLNKKNADWDESDDNEECRFELAKSKYAKGARSDGINYSHLDFSEQTLLDEYGVTDKRLLKYWP